MYIRYCFAAVVVLVLSGCGSGSQVATTTTPPVAPPPATQVTLSVNPSSVEPGQSATLSWSSANATSCTASGDWKGTQQTNGSLNVILPGSKALSFTLACTGANGSPSQTAKLSVALPPGGCTASPAVSPSADRRTSRHRKSLAIGKGL